jgi:hypothetical protein
MLAKTSGTIIDNDATGAFRRVICGIALLALSSIGFASSVTRMLDLTWSKRKCYIKTGFGVSERLYQSTEEKQTFGLGQCSTAAMVMWCINHGMLMHTIVTYFIGIILVSVSGIIQHKGDGEGLIDDTGLVASAQSSTETTSSRNKRFTSDESTIFLKMQKIIQLFIELLQVAGGDLNIAECACFTVFRRWTGGKATLLKMQDSYPIMKITHPHSGEIKIITKKDPTEAHRAIGI